VGGKGLYSSKNFSLPINPYPNRIYTPLQHVLKKKGVKVLPSSFERDYNSGVSTQVPTGLVIGVDRRTNRKIGFNGRFVKYEKVSRS
jgi:hypothetical protein